MTPTDISNFSQSNIDTSIQKIGGQTDSVAASSPADNSFSLGLWILGLNSFLNVGSQVFVDTNNQAKQTNSANQHDWKSEVAITKSALTQIAKLAAQLLSESNKLNSNFLFDEPEYPKTFSTDLGVSLDELSKISLSVRSLSVLADCLLRSNPISFHEWNAWNSLIKSELNNHSAFTNLIERTEMIGGDSPPKKFAEIIANKQLSSDVLADLQSVLPYFNKLFKYLGIIEKMLENDQPLKPTLLFFSAIYQESNDMLTFLRKRISQFNDEENLIFEALDCAVFATSMEVRKVFQGELIGVSTVRQATFLCAKIEAAFGLLRDCFQQTFVGFARFIEPEIDPIELFENFQIKLKQSITLRKDLWETLQIVKAVETKPEEIQIQELQNMLIDFVGGSMKFLMYKDLETVERFVEEVFLTKNSADLVPTLHRFSAYLETLFGQVKMRAVLMNYPFEY